MRVLRFVILASIAATVAFVPISSVPAPVEFSLSADSTGPITEGRQVDDYARLARAIVEVLNTKLKLPVPAYAMEIYSVRSEFEQALVTKTKLKPDVARTTATFAKAFVGNRRVMVNEPALAEWPWPERVVTLAHEIVHACQLELSGHRPLVRYQWLIEGFAEWSSYRVAHELGTVNATSRSDTVMKARGARVTTGLAPLADLDSFEQWVSERKKRGFDARESDLDPRQQAAACKVVLTRHGEELAAGAIATVTQDRIRVRPAEKLDEGDDASRGQ